MHYTVDDVRSAFDSGTYRRGASYFASGMVQSVTLDGDVLKGKVDGSAHAAYQQSIKLTVRDHVVRFKGSCSCPVMQNCKHVVAVLLAADEAGLNTGDAAGELPFAMSQWLANVSYLADSARRQQATPRSVRQTDGRVIYVLMPQAGKGGMRLYLCKGKIAADGVIRSASHISDMHGFQTKPPAYVCPEDRPAAVMFAGLLKSIWGGSTVDVAGDGVAIFLRLTLDAGVLYLAPNRDAMRGGLQQLHAGPARSGRLAWRAEDERLHLGWAFDDGTPIAHLVPSTPPSYIAGDHLGQLDLPADLSVLPVTQWLNLVDQAPELSTAQAVALAGELLDAGLEGLLLRPVVEPGGGKPGHRPRLAHRPGQAGVRLPPDCGRHAGRKNPATATHQGWPGRRGTGQRRRARLAHYAGGSAGSVVQRNKLTACAFSKRTVSLRDMIGNLSAPANRTPTLRWTSRWKSCCPTMNVN